MMNSADRLGAVIMGFFSAAFVAIVFMVSSCTLQQDRVKLPTEALKLRTEHMQKMACIEKRGEWTHVEYTDQCKFTK